uniref:NADH dehydrogenase subunit 2 n=1 Tax=Ergasilus anchoratus TaxID=342414 RepID=UPI002E75E71C|nr:NADH dehydrogenase subunit 2 [Ergasilus anchoratus]UUB71186.1 NADH dehydrogenase subunit 2 [Ergasilus anchoratus]
MQLFNKINLLFMLIISIIMSLSMKSFILIWVFMEIGTMIFIYLMNVENYSHSTISLKYFITQSFISMMMIILYFLLNEQTLISKEIIITCLTAWKLGVPPFQGWFMNIIMDSSWFIFLIMSTFMKILPFLIISIYFTKITLGLALLSILAPAISGVSHLCIKKIMGTSSMFTSGWVMLSMLSSKEVWIMVFAVYSMMMLVFCMSVNSQNMISVDSAISLSASDSFIMFFVLLSLSGIPPMSGFFMKIYILIIILYSKLAFLSLFVVAFSSLSIYMYIKTIFKYMTLNLVDYSFTFDKSPGFKLFLILNLLSGLILLLI